MAKEFAKSFYKSKAWRQCRDAFFIARHGLCERCSGPGKIVHHRIFLNPNNINNPNVTLNFDNLELVCQKCHNNIHHGGSITAEGITFDADGNLIKL